MSDLLQLTAELRQLGDDSAYTEFGVGTEMVSFTTLRSHFNKVNQTALKVLGYFNNSDDYKIVSLSAKDVVLKKNLLEVGYMNLRKVEVFKAGAFTGNVHNFVKLLTKHESHIKNLEMALIDLERNLGVFVNNPEDLTKICTGMKQLKLPSATKLLDEFQDYFMGKSGIDTARLDRLYGNLNQIVDTGTNLMGLTESFNGEDVQVIKDRGDTLYKTLEYVEGALADKGLEMTKEWRHELGKRLYGITEWMAVYSLYITKLVSVSIAHRDSVIKLNHL